MQSWLAEIATPQMAVMIAAIGVAAVVLRKVWPVLRRAVHLVDDLTGEPARPGQPARPGMLERMSSVESRQDDQGRSLIRVERSMARIEDQFHSNGGQSLRDRVDVVDKKLTDHLAGQEG